jgi:hypothetical protein
MERLISTDATGRTFNNFMLHLETWEDDNECRFVKLSLESPITGRFIGEYSTTRTTAIDFFKMFTTAWDMPKEQKNWFRTIFG